MSVRQFLEVLVTGNRRFWFEVGHNSNKGHESNNGNSNHPNGDPTSLAHLIVILACMELFIVEVFDTGHGLDLGKSKSVPVVRAVRERSGLSGFVDSIQVERHNLDSHRKWVVPVDRGFGRLGSLGFEWGISYHALENSLSCPGLWADVGLIDLILLEESDMVVEVELPWEFDLDVKMLQPFLHDLLSFGQVIDNIWGDLLPPTFGVSGKLEEYLVQVMEMVPDNALEGFSSSLHVLVVDGVEEGHDFVGLVFNLELQPSVIEDALSQIEVTLEVFSIQLEVNWVKPL